MEKEPVDLPPAYPTSQPDSRRSSITIHDVTAGSDVEKVEDIEIAKSVPPVSDEHGVDVPSTIKDSPLEEEEFPEGGRGWLVVLGAFIYAGLVLGWPLAWGVFQSYYRSHVFPNASDTTLSLLGTLQNMVMTFTAFVSGKLGDRYGYKPFIGVGSVIAVVGLLTAAFSTELWHFFITQGVIPGLSNGLMFPMIVSYPSMWFKKKRALASGIVVAGSSFGGGVSSLVVRALLTRLGLRNTLLVYAGINAVLLTVAFFLLKSRGPARHVTKIQWVDRNAFGDLVFWSLALCMLFTDFGYLSPVVFLTTYTNDKVPHISAQMSVAPTAVMNFSSAIGRTVVGLTADRIGVTNAFIGSILISATGQLVLWNLAESYAVIMVTSVVVGAFGGCFISLLAPVTAQLFGTSKLATLTGLLVMFNLPGNLAGAPLAGAILSATNRNWHAAISYSGAVQLAGVCVFLYARIKRQPKIFTVF
ncbi:hypothetical protein FRC04_006755 [Tulasnella sp. 424]|nr:hypothetical protein FRC04_006755 [Tulasnella sp. 424]KAG8974305.1 hypothetical protein FRC05_007611 [Tulasnella sp. 425]